MRHPLNDPAFHTAAADPLIAGQLIDFLRDIHPDLFEPKVKPVAAIADLDRLTALEVAVFDNWPQGRRVKGKPCRWGVIMNGSTASAVDVRKWTLRLTAMLTTAKDIEARVEKLQSAKLRHPISTGHATFVMEAVRALGDEYVFGLPASKARGEGTVYPAEHLIALKLDTDGRKVSVEDGLLFVGLNVLPLAPFVSTYAGGKPLPGNVPLQSRWAPKGTMRGWATNSDR